MAWLSPPLSASADNLGMKAALVCEILLIVWPTYLVGAQEERWRWQQKEEKKLTHHVKHNNFSPVIFFHKGRGHVQWRNWGQILDQLSMAWQKRKTNTALSKVFVCFYYGIVQFTIFKKVYIFASFWVTSSCMGVNFTLVPRWLMQVISCVLFNETFMRRSKNGFI